MMASNGYALAVRLLETAAHFQLQLQLQIGFIGGFAIT